MTPNSSPPPADDDRNDGDSPLDAESRTTPDASEHLPFSAEIIEDCERRFHAVESTRGGALESFGVAPIQRNSPDAVKRRLLRLGYSSEQADAACARLSLGNLESIRFGAVDRAAVEEAPSEADVGLERILGSNDLLGIAFLAAGQRRAQSVARVVIKSSRTRQTGYGTGLVVWPGLFLTNNHVLRTAESARFSRVQFNYEDDARGVRQPPIEFELDPTKFFYTNAALDFSLIAVRERSVDGDVALSAYGWNSLHCEPDEILMGESVNIIQHPNGEPKQLALRENEVIAMHGENFLHYRTDTASGSSGSPVYNDQWELVALHHSGVPKRNDEGRIMAIDDRPWTVAMGEHRINWIANEGVRIAAIAAALRAADLPAPQHALREQALAPPASGDADEVFTQASVAPSDPPSPSPTLVSPNSVADALAALLGSTPGAAAGPSSPARPEHAVASADGPAPAASQATITVDIPLQVTVNLGSSGIVARATLRPGAGVPPRDGSPVAPDAEDKDAEDKDAEDKDAALDEAVTIDPDYRSRRGYDPEFLGKGERRVPLPELSAALRKKAAVNQQPTPGRDPLELTYHHYSVVMNKKRRLAFFAAVNIDGRKIAPVPRERDKWFFDPRIARAEQTGSPVYQRNPLDKGHLVRRLDAAWGDDPVEARAASDDTFHWTNCTPQHAEFNRNKTTWAGLEDYVLKNADVEDLKVTVFNGPVFDESDPPYRGVNLPREYWKIVVMKSKSGRLSATAYLLSQQALIQGLEEEFAFGQYKTFQTTVQRIETLTGLRFHDLATFDPLAANATESLGGAPLAEIQSFDDLRLW